MRTLVVAAHPDDEVLGCGGTLARLAKQGEDIQVLLLSDGESSRFDRPGDMPDDVKERRLGAAQRAARTMGVDAPLVLDFPDNKFDTVPLLEIVKAIESVVNDFRPDTVFTHHSGDMNVDHRLVAQAVFTATRPLPGRTVKRLLAFEVLSSSHIATGHFGSFFAPNTFVDIADSLELKLEAMRCYDSELHPFPHPRSLESMRALAIMRGTVCGLSAAEAFVLVRQIRDGSSD